MRLSTVALGRSPGRARLRMWSTSAHRPGVFSCFPIPRLRRQRHVVQSHLRVQKARWSHRSHGKDNLNHSKSVSYKDSETQPMLITVLEPYYSYTTSVLFCSMKGKTSPTFVKVSIPSWKHLRTNTLHMSKANGSLREWSSHDQAKWWVVAFG